MNRLQQRAVILFDLGATVTVADELLAYTQPLSTTTIANAARLTQALLPAEPYLAAWQTIAEAAQDSNAFTALQTHFYQLRCPIREGMSDETAYQTARRYGDFSQIDALGSRFELEHGDDLKLVLVESLGGLVPVLLPNGRSDFTTLIQAFAHKNEPVPVPESMGAAIISGFVNWNRLHQLRDQWLSERVEDPFAEVMWRQELTNHILPHKQLYQDTFIILSDGYYSDVAPDAVGLSADEWQTASHTIRLVHESTHYLMRRLGIARPNHLLDELIADFRGIVAVNGRFRADWFLHFMGLEAFPHCRETGRLHIYRRQLSMSDTAFTLLQRLVYQAALNLEAFYNQESTRIVTPQQQMQLVLALASLTLEELTTPNTADYLEKALSQAANENISSRV